MENENFKGVTCSITMSRTLYLPENSNMSEEEFLKQIKKEIILPHNALYQVQNILRKMNVKGLDLKDWNVDNIEYKII